MLKLVPVMGNAHALRVLWDLLSERKPIENISHKHMPTWANHRTFVESNPYYRWDLIEVDGQTVGCCYLTKQREIGVSIFKAFRGNGFATMALLQLMKEEGGEFLANINPDNEKSINLFHKLGFNRIQVTYKREWK